MNRLLLRTLVAFGLLLPATALAADPANYVFNVPINVSNVPNGVAVQMGCMTSREIGGPILVVATSPTQAVPLNANGSYSGTMSVTIKYAPTADGHWVVPDTYQCYLDFLDAKTNKPVAQPPSRSKVVVVRGSL
jgi:hypothetical protein